MYFTHLDTVSQITALVVTTATTPSALCLSFRAVPAIICAKEDAAVVKCLSHNSMSANPFCCQADLDAYVKCVEEYPIKRK